MHVEKILVDMDAIPVEEVNMIVVPKRQNIVKVINLRQILMEEDTTALALVRSIMLEHVTVLIPMHVAMILYQKLVDIQPITVDVVTVKQDIIHVKVVTSKRG